MTDKDQNFFRELCVAEGTSGARDRLSQIALNEVEKPVQDFVAGLGRIDRPWLISLEEKVLRMLEES